MAARSAYDLALAEAVDAFLAGEAFADELDFSPPVLSPANPVASTNDAPVIQQARLGSLSGSDCFEFAEGCEPPPAPPEPQPDTPELIQCFQNIKQPTRVSMRGEYNNQICRSANFELYSNIQRRLGEMNPADNHLRGVSLRQDFTELRRIFDEAIKVALPPELITSEPVIGTQPFTWRSCWSGSSVDRDLEICLLEN